MNRLIAGIIGFTIAVRAIAGDDLVFHKSRAGWAKEVKVDLVISGERRMILVLGKDADLEKVPFDDIVSFKYERSSHHRVRTGGKIIGNTAEAASGGSVFGAAAVVAVVPAALVVMATKRTDRLLFMKFRTAIGDRELRFKLDPSEALPIIEAIKSETGKDVEIPVETGKGGKKSN